MRGPFQGARMSELLLRVHGLKKSFPVKASAFSSKSLPLRAVDGVSFDLNAGETLGLVGESGCGKTTVGRCILRVYEPDAGRVFIDPDPTVTDEVIALDAEAMRLREEADAITGSGAVAALAGVVTAGTSQERKVAVTGNARAEAHRLRRAAAERKRRADELAADSDLLTMKSGALKRNRRRVQMVFQDPWASLNPYMVVRDIIGEGPREYGTHKGGALDQWVMQLLDKVGLPRSAAGRYPHEFSGGQRQRIGIARALALTPSLVVCDEPVSALDVSIQAQILNLLISLQDDFNLTYIFVAHDLSVVQYVSDRVAVMYLGKVVETARADQLYRKPRHPYTMSLLASVPVADPDVHATDTILEGDVPSPVNPPSGCAFHPRCRFRTDVCSRVTPVLEKEQDGHVIACHNPPHG